MHLLVYRPLAVPLLAAMAARPLSRRLPPAAATWLLTGSAVVLAAASSAVLGLLALTALLRIPAIDAAAGMSAQVLTRNDPASLPVALAAGALLAVSVTAAAGALWHRVSALAAAFGQARRLPGARQVVVTDEDAADAYTVPGWPCRIVVTAGMMRALTTGERRVLLAHERAHAAWFHYLFTSAVRLAAAANPLLRPISAAVGYTVERWADEHAAAVTGDRPLAARAVAQAARAASAGAPSRPRPTGPLAGAGPVVALGVVPRPGVRRRGPGPVPLRVAALLSPPPQPQLLLLAAALLLVAVSGVSALEAMRDLHGLLELAQAGGH
jgi:Zn-dependent protease with chaperone function